MRFLSPKASPNFYLPVKNVINCERNGKILKNCVPALTIRLFY